MKCKICNETFLGHGHNDQPVTNGRCCDVCNDTQVVPTRLNNMLFNIPISTRPKWIFINHLNFSIYSPYYLRVTQKFSLKTMKMHLRFIIRRLRTKK